MMSDNLREMTWMEELNLIEDATNRIKKKVQKEISEIATSAVKGNNLLAGRNQYVWDTAYQRGLDDAWDVAKKIVCNGTMSFTDLVFAFDTDDVGDIFQENTASEAMERLRRWELEKGSPTENQRTCQSSSAQPKTCEGCKHLGKWENEVEYGCSSPCTRCKRRVEDYYER